MTSRWKRIRHALETAGVDAVLAAAGVLAPGPARAVGAGLGALAWHAVRVRRSVVRENLRRAFDADDRPAGRIGAASYASLGRSMMEFAALGTRRGDDLVAGVRFVGLEHFERAHREGRGAILVTGHFGNWELLGAAIAARFPLDFLVGEQTNAAVDRRINALRRRRGIGIIHRGVAARGVLRALAAGRFVAMLVDQDAGRSGVFVPVFGRPASTAPGPARFALRTGAPVIPGFIVPRPGGGHTAFIEPPLRAGSAGDDEAAVVDLTARIAARVEAWVRRYPELYFWPHRRWKTRPPAEPTEPGTGAETRAAGAGPTSGAAASTPRTGEAERLRRPSEG